MASRLLLQGTLVLRKLILILILLNCIKWLLDDVPLAYFKKICLNLILRIRLQESLASLIYSLVGNYLHFLQLVLLLNLLGNLAEGLLEWENIIDLTSLLCSRILLLILRSHSY